MSSPQSADLLIKTTAIRFVEEVGVKLKTQSSSETRASVVVDHTLRDVRNTPY